MPVLEPWTVFLCLIALFVAAVLEVGLFWCAASLADAPSLNLLKTLAIGLVGLIVWGGLGGAVTLGIDRVVPLGAENVVLLSLVGCLVVYISWFFPAMVYAVAVPVPFTRGMLLSVLQVLLRVFLWVLIAAAVMVALAVLQLLRGPGPAPRTELVAPVAQLLAVLG